MRHLYRLVLVAAFLSAPCVASAQEGNWVDKTGAGPVMGHVMASGGGYVYSFGGAEDWTYLVSHGVRRYDPSTDSWVQLPENPYMGNLIQAAIVGDTCYLFGGRLIQTWNIPTGAWNFLPLEITPANAPDSASLSGYGLAVLGNRIYIAGGTLSNYDPGTGVVTHQILGTLQMFDTGPGTLTSRAPLIFRSSGGCMSSIGGRLNLAGGNVPGVGFSTICQQYDPATDTWTLKASMPQAWSWSASGFVLNDRWYVLGDVYLPTGEFSWSMWYYSPDTDTWSISPSLPAGPVRYAFATAQLGGKGYIYGGLVSDPTTGWVWSELFQEFSPADTTSPSIPAPLSPTEGRAFGPGETFDLQWSASTDDRPGMITYEVQVAMTPDFGSTLLDVRSLTVAEFPYVAIEGGTHYWRVRARDAAGNPSAWCATASYGVVTPGVPQSDSEAPGKSCSASTPRPGWAIGLLLAATLMVAFLGRLRLENNLE